MFYILVFTLIHCIYYCVLLSLYPCVSVMWKLNVTYLLTADCQNQCRSCCERPWFIQYVSDL